MPAVAVVAAVGSIGAGLAATSALVSGLLITGGVLTGVGAITGNKKLGQIGAVLSLVGGGIQGFQGLAAAGAAEAGAAELTNVANAADAADAAAGFGRTVSDLSLGEDIASAAKEFETLGSSAAAAGEAAKAAEPVASGLLSQATPAPTLQTPTPTDVATPLATQPVPAPQSTPTVFDEFTRGDASLKPTQAPANIAESGTLADKLKALTAGAGDITDKSLSFIKKNPEASKLLLGAGSGLLGNYQKQAAAEEQARLAEQARARYNQSITGQRRI